MFCFHRSITSNGALSLIDRDKRTKLQVCFHLSHTPSGWKRCKAIAISILSIYKWHNKHGYSWSSSISPDLNIKPMKRVWIWIPIEITLTPVHYWLPYTECWVWWIRLINIFRRIIIFPIGSWIFMKGVSTCLVKSFYFNKINHKKHRVIPV